MFASSWIKYPFPKNVFLPCDINCRELGTNCSQLLLLCQGREQGRCTRNSASQLKGSITRLLIGENAAVQLAGCIQNMFTKYSTPQLKGQNPEITPSLQGISIAWRKERLKLFMFSETQPIVQYCVQPIRIVKTP